MRGNKVQYLIDLVSDWRAENEEWFPTPPFLDCMHFIDEEGAEMINAFRLRLNPDYVRRSQKNMDFEKEAGDLFCMLATAYLHIAGSAHVPMLERATSHAGPAERAMDPSAADIRFDVAIKVFIGSIWHEIGKGVLLSEDEVSGRRPLYEHFWPAFSILMRWPGLDMERAVVTTLDGWSDRVRVAKERRVAEIALEAAGA